MTVELIILAIFLYFVGAIVAFFSRALGSLITTIGTIVIIVAAVHWAYKFIKKRRAKKAAKSNEIELK